MQCKESYRTVYNWQFLHSIRLWTQLLCSHNTIEELKPLICPLVNVIIGTIRYIFSRCMLINYDWHCQLSHRLIASPKLFPMRFHLVSALIRLSEETNTFIPVLPLITEVMRFLSSYKSYNCLLTQVLDHLEANKKNNDSKAVNLDLIIKVSQMKSSDNEYRTAVINKVYDLILHYLSTQSHRISFPELVYMTTIKVLLFSIQ